MYGVVTSVPVTESAFHVASPSKSPLSANTDFRAYQVSQNPGMNYPYYEYQQYPYPYLPNPYYEYPRGGYYYPLNGYQTGVDGFPRTVQNGYTNYPQYGYQFPYYYPYQYQYGK
jgi:hypothetical protein